MKQEDEYKVLQALLRTNFYVFAQKVFATLRPDKVFRPNWHLQTLCYLASCMDQGDFTRLLVNVGPRSLKSTILSIAWPAWMLGHQPSKRIIVASYSEELARDLAGHFRLIVNAEWYQQLFPAMMIARDTEMETATTDGGMRLAVSIGGSITGRGGDVLIVDDPMKASDADSESERQKVNNYFDGTLYSRLDDKKRGIIVVAQQRLHEDDLSGHLLAKDDKIDSSNSFALCHLNLPAIAVQDEEWPLDDHCYHHRKAGEPLNPDQEDMQTLEGIRRMLGDRIFEAQYQQAPMPRTGNIIKRDWLQYYTPADLANAHPTIAFSIDTATKVGQSNDFSVITVWYISENRLYLFDVIRGKWEFPDLKRTVIDLAARYKPSSILIEDTNSGSALLQVLGQETRLNVIGIKPKLDKQTRTIQQSASFEAGRVSFLRDAPWLIDLERELLGFPNAKHDDQVDSITQFLQWVAEHDYFDPAALRICPGSIPKRSNFLDDDDDDEYEGHPNSVKATWFPWEE